MMAESYSGGMQQEEQFKATYKNFSNYVNYYTINYLVTVYTE